jgi:hypothetical protein
MVDNKARMQVAAGIQLMATLQLLYQQNHHPSQLCGYSSQGWLIGAQEDCVTLSEKQKKQKGGNYNKHCNNNTVINNSTNNNKWDVSK